MLCVIAKLDEQAKARLVEMQKIAARFDAALTPLYGHITIASYLPEGEALEASFIAGCKTLLHGQRAFPVYYHQLEVLDASAIIVASPEKAGPLRSIHAVLAEAYDADFNEWTRKENWYPHTTLVFDRQADLPEITRAMQTEFTPFTTQITRLEFSRVLEHGYDIVDSLALRP